MEIKPKKIPYFMGVADLCADESTCLVRHYGAAIVDQDGHIISTGYNGAPSGEIDCKERGWCYRREMNAPPGHYYEKCFSVHAEQNAFLQAGPRANGCWMFVAGKDAATGEPVDAFPCILCTKMAINIKIEMFIVRLANGEIGAITPKDLYTGHLRVISNAVPTVSVGIQQMQNHLSQEEHKMDIGFAQYLDFAGKN